MARRSLAGHSGPFNTCHEAGCPALVQKKRGETHSVSPLVSLESFLLDGKLHGISRVAKQAGCP